MAFLLKRKKNPKQLVEGLVESMRSVQALRLTEFGPNESPPKSKDVTGELSQADKDGLERVGSKLQEIRLMMCGNPDNQPKKEEAVTLVQALCEMGVVPFTLIQNLGVLTFSARNDAAFIVSYMIQRDLGSFATKNLKTHSRKVMRLLVDLFSDPVIALHIGSILRDCLRYEFLCAEFLESSCWIYDRFFDSYLCAESFDISSDSFSTFRDSLKNQPNLVPGFLFDNYDHFFGKYNKLLVSDAYVTQRQSLKLLGELLLDRLNYKVMIKYISDKDNLKIIMNLMRVKSPAIQMEAFHVFKVFVANPKKADPIAMILGRNKDKIIKYLETLSADKDDDEQFIEERDLLVETLRKLQIPETVENQESKPDSTAATAAAGVPPTPPTQTDSVPPAEATATPPVVETSTAASSEPNPQVKDQLS